MFWLRTILFTLPVVAALCFALLFDRIRGSRYLRADEEMVCIIQEPIGALNPLAPLTGSTREVTDLLFEKLFVRDDDLAIRPHLAAAWETRTTLTVHCATEEHAGETEARLLAGELLGEKAPPLESLHREGATLVLVFDGLDDGIEEQVLAAFPRETLANLLLVRLGVRNSARESLETFLRDSIEKNQIRFIDYEGDRVAHIFLDGRSEEHDLLLRELELYYESNQSLDPEIETAGRASHAVHREMLLHLRDDIRWHDGEPVTADDFLFSYRELTRPGSPYPLASSFWFVEEISRADDFTIRVSCDHSPAIMLECWEKLPVLPAHLLEETDPETVWMDFFQSPVGNGPYRIEKRRADGGIVLTANPDSFQGIPAQEKIVYRTLPDRDDRLMTMHLGEFETIELSERDHEWALRQPDLLREIRGVARFQNFVAWNLNHPLLAERKVRTALAWAVDTGKLLSSGPNYREQACESLYYPGVPYVDEPMFLPEHNLKTAARHLEEAGFSRAEDIAEGTGNSGEKEKDQEKARGPEGFWTTERSEPEAKPEIAGAQRRQIDAPQVRPKGKPKPKPKPEGRAAQAGAANQKEKEVQNELSGAWVNEAGETLRFTLTVNRDNAEHLALAEGLVRQWRELGVEAELELLPWSGILSRRLAPREFEAALLGWELPFERDRFSTWHSSQTGPEGGNFTGLRDDTVDRLLENIRLEKDEDRSRILCAELQKEIAQLQPCLFLCDTARVVQVRRDALATLRPAPSPGAKRETQPLGIGKAGIERARPWWVRRELVPAN